MGLPTEKRARVMGGAGGTGKADRADRADRIGAFDRLTVQPSNRLLRAALLLIGGTILLATGLRAQQPHLVIISGISGGPEYAERFRGWATQLIDAAEHRMNVPAANIVY